MLRKIKILNIKNYFLGGMNPVVRFLIMSDTVLFSATAMLGPVFAIFIEDSIIGGNAAVIGLASGIYLLSKSVLQVPIAHYIDKIKGEKDDFWILIGGTLIISIIPLLYLIISTPIQLYVVQFILGVANAFVGPTFYGIFTRHIDKQKESIEWGTYFSMTDLSSATFAVIGGYITTYYGFHALIWSVFGITFIGSLIIWPIKNYMKMPKVAKN